MWLEDPDKDGVADSVVIDLDSNVLVAARVQVVKARDFETGKFDSDGQKDDARYTVSYSLSNYRVVQPRIVLIIDDYNHDLTVDAVKLSH